MNDDQLSELMQHIESEPSAASAGWNPWALLLVDYARVAVPKMRERIELLTAENAGLRKFAAGLWELDKDLAIQTAECDDEEYAAWASGMIDAAKSLGIERMRQ